MENMYKLMVLLQQHSIFASLTGKKKSSVISVFVCSCFIILHMDWYLFWGSSEKGKTAKMSAL